MVKMPPHLKLRPLPHDSVQGFLSPTAAVTFEIGVAVQGSQRHVNELTTSSVSTVTRFTQWNRNAVITTLIVQ